MAPLADAVRFSRIGELIAGDGRRPDRAGFKQFGHAFEMGAVAVDFGPQNLDVGAVGFEPRLAAGDDPL